MHTPEENGHAATTIEHPELPAGVEDTRKSSFPRDFSTQGPAVALILTDFCSKSPHLLPLSQQPWEIKIGI